MKISILKTILIGATALIFSNLLYADSIQKAIKENKGQVNTTLPKNYQLLSGCEKQEILWSEVEKTKHKKLPKLSKLGLFEVLGMAMQTLTTKSERLDDIAPKGWKKYLHKRGAVAKVKFVSNGAHPYTGIFEGADCALLRLSLTYRPKGDKPVAPGLAFKVLRNGVHSANISALYTLSGQKKDYNYFTNPLSNIVPIGSSKGEKLVHSIFKRVSDYPEELVIKDMSVYKSNGEKVSSQKNPRQIFFVPSPDVTEMFKSDEHDVRDDFLKIPEKTTLYTVYAVSDAKKDYNYYDYNYEDIRKFLKDSKPVGTIVTSSPFIASEFGDKRLFFRHEVRED